MDRIVSVSTQAFDGYSLEVALDELAGLGVTHVEPASVDKIFHHLVETDFCDDRAAWLRGQLASRGLACHALSVHMDMTQPDAVDRFRRRLDFAHGIGARRVNSIAGPAERLDGFRRNLPAIAARAADLGIVIGLENHADLVGHQHQVLAFIGEINHPAVRVNYDTGNAWYYSRGAIDPVEELALLAPVVAHVHLKTPIVENGMMRWTALGEGLLNLPGIGRVLKTTMPGVPVSYELSPRQRTRDFEPRWRAPEIPPLSETRDMVRRSLRALDRALA